MTMRRAAYAWIFWTAGVAMATSVGCSSHVDTLAQVRTLYHGGQLELAAERVDEAMERRFSAKERDVLALDRAMIDLVSGRPAEAEAKLRTARDRFDALEQKDAAELALAMLNDDTSLSYPGEDYEKVLLRAFLSISNLLHDGRDARAYGYQVSMKQDAIVQKACDKDGKNPKLSYKRVALGPYLVGTLDEMSYTSLSEAERSYTQLVSWAPDLQAGHDALQRASRGQHSAPGNGVVYVFALVGRGPYKIEVNETDTQIGLLIADRILTATNKHSLTPTLAPVKVPRVVADLSRIDSVGVTVDGAPVGSTETITDVTKMAVEQYDAVYPQVIGRAIARRAVKKATLYGAKEAMQVGHPAAELAVDVVGVAWEATENADTRCWGLLPDRIQVLRVEMPAGRHRLGLSAVGAGGYNGAVHEQTVEVLNGRNTYVLAAFPDANLVGRIVCNTP